MNESAPSRFSNADEIQQLDEYRRFNLMAMLSAVVGVASVGVLASPFLVVLPFLAMFLGACGLGLYHRRQELGGRIPSWIGISLAVFFMAWASAQFGFGRCVLYAEATNVVHKWVDLVVNGEREIAHQAMMEPAQRQASGLSVDEYYAMDAEVAESMMEVFSKPPLSDVLGMGAETQVSLVKNVSLKHDLGADYIQQVYRLAPPEGDPVELKISTNRRFSETANRANWSIGGVVANKESSPSLLEHLSAFVTRMLK